MLTIDAHVDVPWVLTKYGYRSLDLSEWAATEGLDKAIMAVYLSHDHITKAGLGHVESQLAWIRTERHPFSIEGAHLLGPDPIGRLETLIESGLTPTYLTLVHNNTNAFADSATDASQHDGLSNAGRDLVKACERLGVWIDVSHASEAVTMDVLDLAVPLIASHSGCRNMYDHTRNLWSGTIKDIAQAGGVIGIPFVKKFLGDRTFFAHVAYAVGLVGADHVAVGSDLDGALLTTAFTDTMDWKAFVVDGLYSNGLSDDEIERIAGLNWYDTFGMSA